MHTPDLSTATVRVGPTTVDPAVIAEFTPTGRLRAVINLGNPILARHDPQAGEPAGVSVDLARRFAEQIGADIELIPVAVAQAAVDAVTRQEADIGFFAIDPARGAGIAFTAAYVLIEGSYLVADGSALVDNDEVDRDGTTVVVGQGSAYDLFLSRTLAHATLVRVESSQAVVDTFVAKQWDVAAGVRQQLETDAKRVPGVRLLPGRFMVIQQAMGLPKGRSSAALALLRRFVEDAKADGFVEQALLRHRIEGAGVAPSA